MPSKPIIAAVAVFTFIGVRNDCLGPLSYNRISLMGG
jgi:ABC-type glycerol-3-phosphate transport system permease component